VLAALPRRFASQTPMAMRTTSKQAQHVTRPYTLLRLLRPLWAFVELQYISMDAD
jgi:hypothetical protein